MNPSSTTLRQVADIDRVFQSQRAAFARHPHPSLEDRRASLDAITHLLRDNGELIAAAIDADFGHRSRHETQLLELFPAMQATKHARANVARWMRPERKSVSPWFWFGSARVVKQPLGVAGVIVPWNYPLYLSVGPLVSALAAGNRVMVKMSELSPRTGELLAKLLGKRFADDHVAVINGDADVGRTFAAQPFDHLLFTGSTAVGRRVMAAAAENLIPVTLALGGKSPAIVAPGFPVEVAARRIIWGKCLNAGQTCIAPDYAIVPDDQVEEFVAACRLEAAKLYPEGAASCDYTSIINARHYDRLQGYLENARANGAHILSLIGGESSAARKLPPTLVIGASEGAQIMQEEIFGPLVPYRTFDEALAYVAARPRPLAMYYFDKDRQRTRRVLAESLAGGVTVNDAMLQIAQDDLPFGGVGASGMGQYHGVEGFNAFSKRKGVFTQSWLNGVRLFKPPYGKRVERLLGWMLK